MQIQYNYCIEGVNGRRVELLGVYGGTKSILC